VPRSSTRVVCGKCQEASFRRFVPSFRISDTKRVFGAFLNRRSHHPGAGCASARPSSVEEGSKMSNLQSDNDACRLRTSPLTPKPLFHVGERGADTRERSGIRTITQTCHYDFRPSITLTSL
jgi:hypothetical protein